MKHIRALALLLTLALLLGSFTPLGIAEEAAPLDEKIELTAPPAEEDIEVVSAPSDAEITALEEDEPEIVAPPVEDEALPAEPAFVIEDGILTAYTGVEVDVVLPEDVIVIAGYAFADNAALVSVTCPDGLRAIEDYAFAGCAALERVVYPETAVVGDMAFEDSALAVPTEGEAEISESEEGNDKVVSRAVSTFTYWPSDQTVHVNDTVFLSIGFSGSVLYNCQWQYLVSGSNNWIDAVSKGAKSSSWSFKATASMNGRQYRCRVTDDNGTFYSEPMLLTVVEQSTIVSQPKDVHVAVGETVVIEFSATGYKLTYLWQKCPKGSLEWFNTVSFPNAPYATFLASKKFDGYKYRCAVTDGTGYTFYTNAITLHVSDSPFITTQPVEETVATDGKSVTLSVGASGSSLSYQWQYKKPGDTTWTNATSADAKSASWQFDAKYAWSGRQYRCVVTDSNGVSVVSDSTTLTVNPAPPIITQQPQDVTIEVGEKAIISIVATGTGLTYKWQFIDPGQTSFTTIDSVTGARWTTTGDLSKNGRQYRCVITNVEGKVVKSNRMTLTVVSRRLSITTQPTDKTVIDGRNVTLSVSASGSSLSYQWQYKKPGSSTWTNATSDGAKSASWKFTAKYALSGRQYRCVIKDSSGNSVTSNAITLTVTAAPPVITAQPQNLTLEVSEKGTISVTATGTGLTYKWQFIDPGKTSWTTIGSVTSAKWTTTGDPSKNGRQYRCVITNIDGKVVKSNRMTLTVVVPLTIPELPKNVKAWALSDSEIAVSWDPVYNADGYYIYLAFEEEAGSGDVQELLREIPDGLTGYTTVSGLKKSIYYDIKVIPYNDAGSLDPEDSNSYVSVWVGPPLAPYYVNTWRLSGRTYAINWWTVDNADGYYIDVIHNIENGPDVPPITRTCLASTIPKNSHDTHDWYITVELPEIELGEEWYEEGYSFDIHVEVRAYNAFGESDICWGDL